MTTDHSKYEAVLSHLTRQCGTCDLCCTTVGVVELGKRAGERCKHLCGEPGRSCAIYADRPFDCHEYLCVWRGSDNLLTDDFYPPDCGFVLSLSTKAGDWPRLITVTVDPARPLEWKQPKWFGQFFRIARLLNCAIVIGEWHDAQMVFSPMGNIFSRKNHPEFFDDDGANVGLPEDEFLADRLTPEEFGMRLIYAERALAFNSG